MSKNILKDIYSKDFSTMTLFEIVDILKKIALNQPNIRSVSDGSVYDALNNNPSVHYDVFHISQTTHQEDFETDYYGLQLFYISRLEDSLEDNRLQIQSIGKEILGNVIRTFSENFSIDYPTITYIPFTQRFNDLTAGVYCNVRLEVPKDLVCADDYTAETVPGSGLKLQDIGITITENGLRVITADAEYDGIGEIRIQTEVPQSAAVLQDKEVEYTENGSYSISPDPAYDGLSSVSVDVLVPDKYDEGYDDGKQDGEAEQKAKLTVTSFTENNTYTRENGWSAVTVNVPATEDRYDEGYADGIEAQKAKMVATAITENGEYGRPDGYSAVTVDVPDRYDEGYANGFDDGIEDQKGKLTTLNVNENGIYTREDGWSAITVAVSQTGSSNADLIANLQGDYYLIPYGTTHLRDYAFYITCFSSITIPTTVSAIGKDAFAFNECLTSITIPDSVQYLGIYTFQGARALETVIIGSGISEIQTRTFSGCRALTGITIPSGVTSIGINVFDGCSALTEMTFEGLTPPTLEDTGNSLGRTAYTFPIYVPCQSLDAYKTAFGEYYAPRIQCREQEMITAITLNVSSALTDNGTATTTYSPSNAYVDYYYTSSNPSIATIDPNTGVITVVANGSVTICTIDRISGLQDCKEVSVAKSSPYATALTLNVDSVIENNGIATVTIEPATATKNITFSSSDATKATIDENGVITVIADGTVTFCATDTYSGLEDCKTVSVVKTEPIIPTTAFGMAIYTVSSTTSSIDILSKSGYQSFDYMIYDGVRYDITSSADSRFRFNATGLQTVYYHLKNPEHIGNAFALWAGDRLIDKLVHFEIPGTVKSLGDTFRYCKGLTGITIPSSVTSIGEGTFYSCSAITGVSFETPSSLKKFGYLTNSKVKTLDIPDSVTAITICSGNKQLTGITIGTGIKEIYASTFNGCTAIKQVTVNAVTPPRIGTGIIPTNSLQHIYVPAESVNAYKSAWSAYAGYITAKP